ncbi:hypothetical protein [Kaistia sp. MMO-174]|uniref:hypothetical protein n=1 Tax=Kaistia sp. MMO-174 TaxID=3081256 RepID=UPI0030167C7C
MNSTADLISQHKQLAVFTRKFVDMTGDESKTTEEKLEVVINCVLQILLSEQNAIAEKIRVSQW